MSMAEQCVLQTEVLPPSLQQSASSTALGHHGRSSTRGMEDDRGVAEVPGSPGPRNLTILRCKLSNNENSAMEL